MKRKILLDFDPERKETIKIGSETEGSPWKDLAICLEGAGCLAAICKFDLGIKEHNGKQLNEYLHEYLDRVLNDYQRSYQTRFGCKSN